jgi:hypothetical protein
MSVWSASTGRNSVFGVETGAGAFPASHPPIHSHTHAHNHGSNDHCFHKRIHNCQVSANLFFYIL